MVRSTLDAHTHVHAVWHSLVPKFAGLVFSISAWQEVQFGIANTPQTLILEGVDMDGAGGS